MCAPLLLLLQVPFALMATAYRRKRLMEGIINGDKEVQAQIQQISDKHVLEQLQATKAAEVESLRNKNRQGDGSARGSGSGQASPSFRSKVKRIGQVNMDKQILSSLSPDERKLVSSVMDKARAAGISGSGSASPGAMRSSLPPLEGGMASLSMSMSGGMGRGPAGALGGTVPSAFGFGGSGDGMGMGGNNTLRSSVGGSGSFSASPLHKQLMEMPQTFDLRFNHSSVIKLPPGAGGLGRPLDTTLSPGAGGSGPSGPSSSSGPLSLGGTLGRTGSASRRSGGLGGGYGGSPLHSEELPKLSPRQPMGKLLGQGLASPARR